MSGKGKNIMWNQIKLKGKMTSLKDCEARLRGGGTSGGLVEELKGDKNG